MLLSGAAFAGAGANMNACIYLPVKPSSAMTVNFTAGGPGSHCMNNKGNDAAMTVTNAGVTCASVGYVEGKSSSSGGDACATDTSYWPLSYKTSVGGTPAPYSGSTSTTWSHPLFGSNHLTLKDQSKGTGACATSDLCTSTSQQWDAGSQGPLYIIFQPQAQ